MEENIMTLIGNGNDTRLWLDKWHPKGVLVKAYGEQIRYDARHDRLCKVNSILMNGEWRPGPATSHTLMEAWATLASIEKLNFNDQDKVVWTATAHGNFTTKSAWHLVREVGTSVDWHKVVWRGR